MKTAYVTGATGCVGRNLIDELAKDNWDVVVLHRKSSDLSRLAGTPVRFQGVDLYDLESARKAIVESRDALFHVAGNTSHWAREQEKQWKDNVLVTRNLVEVALERKIGRFIFTSTGATLSYQNLDERLAKRIKIPYIRTKRLGELEVYQGAERGLDVVILHPIIVVGPYDYSNYAQIFGAMKKSLLKMAFPGKISFVHAGDVARAHVLAFEKGRSCERYVLGGTYTTWLDFFQRVCHAVGTTPPEKATPRWLLGVIALVLETLSFFTQRKPPLSTEVVGLLSDAPDVTYYDKRRVREDLGFEARGLDEAIRDTYSWLVSVNRI